MTASALEYLLNDAKQSYESMLSSLAHYELMRANLAQVSTDEAFGRLMLSLRKADGELDEGALAHITEIMCDLNQSLASSGIGLVLLWSLFSGDCQVEVISE